MAASTADLSKQLPAGGPGLRRQPARAGEPWWHRGDELGRARVALAAHASPAFRYPMVSHATTPPAAQMAAEPCMAWV
jgi:hypothetical protein